MFGRSFREVVRTLTVSYPIPFLSALLLVFALMSLALSAFVPVAMSWVAGLLGIAGFMTAAGIIVWAVAKKPELLRSEQHTISSRVLDMLDDNEMPPADRARLMIGVMQASKTALDPGSGPIDGDTSDGD